MRSNSSFLGKYMGGDGIQICVTPTILIKVVLKTTKEHYLNRPLY